MEIFGFIFSSLILLAGVLLSARVHRNIGRKTPHRGREPDSARYQYMKDLRRMERRRFRVWWKMDELHAEFTKRNTARVAAEQARTEVTRKADGREYGGASIPGDLREAFEEFLRRG
jgi:hypothetical protein